MTTPREIIARASTPNPDDCWHGSGSLGPSASEFTCHVYMWQRELPRADAILTALAAAGYRILGPDEVDPVTLEEAAAIAEATQAYGDPVDASVGLGPVGKRIASAIRALGRKS